MKILLCVAFLFVGCGYSEPDDEYETEKPVAVEEAEFKDIVEYIDTYCGGCHDGDSKPIINESNWAKARAKIEDGTMPKNGELPPIIKELMLEVK